MVHVCKGGTFLAEKCALWKTLQIIFSDVGNCEVGHVTSRTRLVAWHSGNQAALFVAFLHLSGFKTGTGKAGKELMMVPGKAK